MKSCLYVCVNCVCVYCVFVYIYRVWQKDYSCEYVKQFILILLIIVLFSLQVTVRLLLPCPVCFY